MSEHVTGWRKSTRSAQQTDCVEVGRTTSGAAVRDTKDRDGGMLTVGGQQWAAFVSALKDGRY